MGESDDRKLWHFIEQVRLLIQRDPMEGLGSWASLFTQLRQAGKYELCDRLVYEIKNVEISGDLPPHGLAIIRYAEGWYYDRAGEWQEAVKTYEKALDGFGTSNLPLDVEVLTQIGSIYQDQGDFDTAEDAYQRALNAAGGRSDPHGRALVLNNLGGLCALRYDYATARRHFEEAKAIFDATNDRQNSAAAGVGIADTLRDEGRLQDAVDQLVQSLLVFRDLGNMHSMAMTVGSLALTYHIAGRRPEAIHNYQAALEILSQIKDRSGGTPQTLLNLALVLKDEDRLDQARSFMEQAVAQYVKLGDRHGESLARSALERLDRHRPEPGQAQG